MRNSDAFSPPFQPKGLLVVLTQDPDSVKGVLNVYCPEATLLDAGGVTRDEPDYECCEHHLPPLKSTMKKVAKNLINEAMRLSGGHQTQAAAYLGITQQALSLRLKQYPGLMESYQKNA